MGLLVGLPLRIFYMLFSLLRLVWPVLLILLVLFLLRRRRGGGGSARTWRAEPKEPEFDGPVVDVEYREVEDDGEV